jgi:2-dehydropantoate 2-reductase
MAGKRVCDEIHPMRIAVVGVGGVGGYFGGRLAEAGEDVTFIARGATLAALRKRGLKVESINGGFTLHPCQATADPRSIGIVDAVLVGVKAWQMHEAAESIRPIVGPNTVVVTLQNGVEAADHAAAVVGKAHVAPGVCGIVAFIVEPGHIRHAAAAPFVKFGEMDNRLSSRLSLLAEAFMRANVTAEVAADVRVALWSKLLFLGPSSGIGALTRSPIGSWRVVSESRAMMERAMDEILAVAVASGVSMPADAKARAIAHVDNVAPDATMSMQRDIAAGRPSELDAQIGAIVRMGKERGVATPAHSMLLEALTPR